MGRYAHDTFLKLEKPEKLRYKFQFPLQQKENKLIAFAGKWPLCNPGRAESSCGLGLGGLGEMYRTDTPQMKGLYALIRDL